MWELYKKHTVVKVGDGQRTKFWKDIWCGEEALEMRYNSLYNVVGSKKAMAAKLYVKDAHRGSWNLGFLRRFNDLELEEVHLYRVGKLGADGE